MLKFCITLFRYFMIKVIIKTFKQKYTVIVITQNIKLYNTMHAYLTQLTDTFTHLLLCIGPKELATAESNTAFILMSIKPQSLSRRRPNKPILMHSILCFLVIKIKFIITVKNLRNGVLIVVEIRHKWYAVQYYQETGVKQCKNPCQLIRNILFKQPEFVLPF